MKGCICIRDCDLVRNIAHSFNTLDGQQGVSFNPHWTHFTFVLSFGGQLVGLNVLHQQAIVGS